MKLKPFSIQAITFIFFLSVLMAPFSSTGGDKKNVGIRAGYQNAAMYSKDYSMWNHSLNSFYIGGYKEVKFFPFMHFGAGLEYFINGNQIDADNKLLLHYLSVPLDLKFKLGPLYAMGGLSANFKVGEKVYVQGIKMDPQEGNKTGVFDASAFLGAGVNIFMIGIEARYHFGLMDVNNGYHNNYLQIGLTLHF
ncbi:MAG: outer membrane beta-barrel protein [Bacteroidetes bacterium]|nr:outer membrane beta-barrel protein [Bacteroidota bacterium]